MVCSPHRTRMGSVPCPATRPSTKTRFPAAAAGGLMSPLVAGAGGTGVASLPAATAIEAAEERAARVTEGGEGAGLAELEGAEDMVRVVVPEDAPAAENDTTTWGGGRVDSRR